MDSEERVAFLEAAMARMLEPMKGVPFSIIIRVLTGNEVIPFDEKKSGDAELLRLIDKAASLVCESLESNPIIRPRPNEVGNDMEPYVIDAFQAVGLDCERPQTKDGKGKTTGYPDILITNSSEVPTYVECKVYSEDSKDTTFRAFYLSPSNQPKVTCDARHLVLGFQHSSEPIGDEGSKAYKVVGYTLVDIRDLLCDMKYEFNASNRNLYGQGKILAQRMFYR